jgi:osmoprotectant transport system ATP-binding protein
MSGAPIIELKNIEKHYGEKTILTNFSLKIENNEFITAIGSSGCGKTTVLKLINGLIKPDSGSVLIKGQDIAAMNQDKLRRKIGYVIQGIGLFPHMRIKDNITYVLRLNKMKKAEIEEKLAGLMETVQLDNNLLSSYPHQLSGGQRQRVGLARALAARPDIILMDEPFGAVDDITRKKLQKEIKKIHAKTQTTIFFITHDISEAMTLATRMLVMDKGTIHQFAAPAAVRANPSTPFVAELVNSSAD